jgi:5-(carboxyamino)imidazole ribonucleotide synthase
MKAVSLGSLRLRYPLFRPWGRISRQIANAVLAVEIFVVQGPGQRDPPRVHNSGHWTLDGASISQFEQHIRAIAG